MTEAALASNTGAHSQKDNSTLGTLLILDPFLKEMGPFPRYFYDAYYGFPERAFYAVYGKTFSGDI